jgi:hypothetical protein
MLRNIPVVIIGLIPSSIKLPLFEARICLMKNRGSDWEIYDDPYIGI